MSQPQPNKITLRPLQKRDLEQLVEWINAPHVAAWWDGSVDLSAVIEKYEPRLQDDSPTRVFMIELVCRPVGMIQCYRHKDYPEWDRTVGIERAAGIDYLIGEADCRGQGIAPRVDLLKRAQLSAQSMRLARKTCLWW